MNSFGQIFRLTTWGESHGPAIGGVIDGMPAGLKIDFEALHTMMARRRPGSGITASARNEHDRVELLSGIMDGVTTGTPIGFSIGNYDARSADYEPLKHTFRPSHADYTYFAKYGLRDYRGGGRASARETACRVVGGALAMQALAVNGINIHAWVSRVGQVASPDGLSPDKATLKAMLSTIAEAKASHDSLGGIVSARITGLPPGLGEPVFDKLQSRLAAAMMSIPAAKGFDYGMGFDGASRRGSEMIDLFNPDGPDITLTNHSGGIQGGISNGMPIDLRVAFKPVATLPRKLPAIDDKGNATTVDAGGRHDPTVVFRAVPVVESMAAMTILDAILLDRTTRLQSHRL